jgi:hypothetical protein
MKTSMLAKLHEAREARVPVALISDIGDGSQRLVSRKEAADDKRLPPLPGADNLGGRPAPRLVLRGLILMGGIEIKS